jgi:hypothetical protein
VYDEDLVEGYDSLEVLDLDPFSQTLLPPEDDSSFPWEDPNDASTWLSL